MIEVKVTTNLPQFAKEVAKISEQLRDQAVVRALNKTAAIAKTDAARNVRAVGFGIKSAAIKKSIVIQRATKRDLQAALEISGRRIPLIDYGARRVTTGVSVKVLHGRKQVKGAFIATMKSGHEGVFWRKQGTQMGKRGKPILNRKIEELWGPSVPFAVLNQEVRRAIETTIATRFPQVLAQEFRFVLLKAGLK